PLNNDRYSRQSLSVSVRHPSLDGNAFFIDLNFDTPLAVSFRTDYADGVIDLLKIQVSLPCDFQQVFLHIRRLPRKSDSGFVFYDLIRVKEPEIRLSFCLLKKILQGIFHPVQL